jgi:hypothetical protein
MDDEPSDEIAHLEQHIERLADSIERCRKIALAGRLMIAAGSVWVALVLFGVIPLAPYAVVAAIAAVIGGIVLTGSNRTTWQQTEAALRSSEALRAELIDRIPLRVVGE